jgi:hypothetical protein
MLYPKLVFHTWHILLQFNHWRLQEKLRIQGIILNKIANNIDCFIESGFIIELQCFSIMQSAEYQISDTYLSYKHMIGSTWHPGAAAVCISHTWSHHMESIYTLTQATSVVRNDKPQATALAFEHNNKFSLETCSVLSVKSKKPHTVETANFLGIP